MKTLGLLLALASASTLAAQEPQAADVVFAAALDNVLSELRGAPPADLHRLPDGAIAVARRTIGGAPAGYRAFVDKWFGTVIAEEMLQSYGENGPASRLIDQATAGPFAVLPLEQFESGPFAYDWQRLNEKYPNVRYVVRLSRPALDRLGTYAVVRYELIGRDRREHGSFIKFEKQTDGSWKRTIGVVGSIWN